MDVFTFFYRDAMGNKVYHTKRGVVTHCDDFAIAKCIRLELANVDGRTWCIGPMAHAAIHRPPTPLEALRRAWHALIVFDSNSPRYRAN